MTLTRNVLLDFIALAIEIAAETDQPLADALTTAAIIYPELASISADTQACELVWERYGR